jgi:holdfast attachment protein HfaA
MKPVSYIRFAAAGLIMVMSLPAAASAQSMTANSATYNAGYGRTAGQENRPVDVSTRDANGNRIVVDGLILTGDDQSVFSRAGATAGAGDVFSGAGANGSASAIGNNLVVVTQGSYNTVIISSQQTNNGNQTATTTITGGP